MHLTDEQLNEYLDHESNDRAQMELHLSTCEDCAARLTALQELFSEIESLPEVAISAPFAARLVFNQNKPGRFSRSLVLIMSLQAVLALTAIIVAAPFVVEFLSPYVSNLPSPVDIFLPLQIQWAAWLDRLSQFQMPPLPEIPSIEISSFVLIWAVLGAFLLWLIGNRLLLRKQMK